MGLGARAQEVRGLRSEPGTISAVLYMEVGHKLGLFGTSGFPKQNFKS